MAQVRSGSFTTTSYSGRSITFNWSLASQSIENNTSTINWSFVGSGSATSWYNTRNGYVNIDGARRWTQASDVQLRNGTTMASGTLTITHNADGKRSFSADGGATIYNYGTYQTGSGSWELPQIPRAATLTTAPNFTDEGNPTITYSNPAGSAVSSLKACIADINGQSLYTEYRDIPIDGTAYTFNLTEQERENLRWASINSPNLAVKFYVTTVIGGNTYYSTLDKIVNIVNANPTIEASAIDVGTASTLLTGDNKTIIKGHNYISVSQTATSYKGSSIKKQTISCGGQVIEGASGSLVNVDSGDITFSATDSRGFTTTKTINLKVIDYIKLTCNLTASLPNALGEMTFNVKGNYFNGSFGATNNTLQVFYRIKKEDEAYSDWIELPTEDGYNITARLTGLDYKAKYTLQAKAKDKVLEVLSAERVIKAIPVFDWSKNDFKFKVDVFDKNGAKLGTDLTSNDYDSLCQSGKSLLETGWVAITPSGANTPTSVFVGFKRHYEKIPVVLVTASSGVIGTQVLGASVNGITNDGVNIVLTRTNKTPTTIYFYVFGEVDE